MILKPAVVLDICNSSFWNQQRGQRLQWGLPTLDVFAGPLAAEHVTHLFSHVQHQYYTKYWCQQSLGADAFMHDWSVGHGVLGYQLAWVYPPQELIVRALMQLISHPVHAILILPSKVALWTPLLQWMPIVAKRQVYPKTGIYTLGAGAPPAWTADRPLLLTAWRVWPGLQRCVGA